MEDIREVKKVIVWNLNGLRAKEQSKNRWTDEVINHLRNSR
jgi:hypothetical protein